MLSDKSSKYGAVYSDGETARPHNLTVVFGVEGLELFDEQEQPFAVWSYDQINSVEHLHAGDAAQLGHKEKPGERLYIDRRDFAAELIAHVPHMSRQAANRRVFIPLAIIGVLIFSVIGAIWIAGYSIPQAIAHLIPDKMRKGMGTQVVAGLSGGKTACSGREGAKAFTKLVDRLAKGAGQAGKFDVQIIELGMMNAFAAPGERIVVSKKLVNFVTSPEELAGVIAHEMGHGTRMHPEAGIVRALGISAAISIAFGGSTGGFGDVGAMLLQLKYSRSAEFEADAIALKTLENAEIPAKPFAAFFVRLEEKHGSGKRQKTSKGKADKGEQNNSKNEKLVAKGRLMKTLELLSTHPSSPERIAIIEKQPQWKTRPLLDKTEWKALRSICDEG